MNCPTTDKLSQFTDDLLPPKEADQLQRHIDSCVHCREAVALFAGEQEFIKETLRTPELPDDFAHTVLEQLEPYPQKKARWRAPLKKVLLSAAGVVLAAGIGAAVSPSFAQLIGGFFSTEQADGGLQLAFEEGLAERVDLQAEDQGITLKVEDVVADTSRVTLSYQVLKNGKPQSTYLDWPELDNQVTAFDADGREIQNLGTGWWDGGEYGLIEFSLREYGAIDQLNIRFNLTELNGVKGNWQLDVPVDLREKSELTAVHSLEGASYTANGVNIALQKLQLAPSSTELFYETSFTEKQLAEIEHAADQFEKRFGTAHAETLQNIFDTAIAYHLEDDNGNVQAAWNQWSEEKGHSEDIGALQSTGENLNEIGSLQWVNSFIPKKDQPNLSFVLDGVYKTVPADFSIKIKPKELKNKPAVFEFEGNEITVTQAKNKTNYFLRKSLNPVGRESEFVIKMEGKRAGDASELGWWIVEAGEENVYLSGMSGSVSNEDLDMELTFPAFEEVPEELTLHLVSVTRYEAAEEEWRVGLE